VLVRFLKCSSVLSTKPYGGGLTASAAWNLDFWGLYRRQTEAARAELLASQWAQRATRVTLVQDVAQAYFQLRSPTPQI
jgi:multidrug efflux system outer membrane protein